jgi:hypothetical protein
LTRCMTNPSPVFRLENVQGIGHRRSGTLA